MKLKNIALALLLSSFALMGTLSSAAYASDDKDSADEMKCRQEIEHKCELSQYGQTNCKLKAEQECKMKSAKKVVVVEEREKVRGVFHEPVDTALDLKTAAAALIALGTGPAALIVKRKIA